MDLIQEYMGDCNRGRRGRKDTINQNTGSGRILVDTDQSEEFFQYRKEFVWGAIAFPAEVVKRHRPASTKLLSRLCVRKMRK